MILAYTHRKAYSPRKSLSLLDCKIDGTCMPLGSMDSSALFLYLGVMILLKKMIILLELCSNTKDESASYFVKLHF